MKPVQAIQPLIRLEAAIALVYMRENRRRAGMHDIVSNPDFKAQKIQQLKSARATSRQLAKISAS
jgi:hypothetical protein